MRGEAIELVLPEAPIRVEPRRGVTHRGRDQAYATHPPVPPPLDQVRPFQHAEVLADGRERHWERTRQLPNGGLPRREAGHDASARGIGEGAEDHVEGGF